MTTRQEVYQAIDEERAYQARKYGKDKQQSLAGFLLILESELNEAKLGWIKNSTGRSAPLHEILQIAAVCVGCLEKYGTVGTAGVTDDVSYEAFYKQHGEPQPLSSETEQKVRFMDPHNHHNEGGVPK